MASLLMRPLRPALGLGLGLSITALHLTHQRPLRMDSGAISSPAFSTESYRQNAKAPVLSNGKLNPSAVRQISSGSIIGA